ncbi:MAG: ubiquitin, partial [Thermacetogeniaceae bacterium]
MDELLKKIDLIRERMDVSYREARDALDRASGDVVGALVLLEEELQGCHLCQKLKETLEKGISTKLRLKKGDHTILEFPAGRAGFS